LNENNKMNGQREPFEYQIIEFVHVFLIIYCSLLESQSRPSFLVNELSLNMIHHLICKVRTKTVSLVKQALFSLLYLTSVQLAIVFVLFLWPLNCRHLLDLRFELIPLIFFLFFLGMI
jgi:hypothetical protein